MAIGSVSVEVVPDARGFHRKLSAELRDLEVKVNVNADTARAKAQLDRLGAERKSVIVHAKADTAVAAAKLDELARTRTASVKADVDKSSFRTADSAVAKTAGNMNLLLESAVALAPALIPATAALGALAGALVAPIASAGAGVGIFGIISGAALVKATKDAKAIADLNKKAAAASDPKAAAAFTKQADALTKSLPKAERAFLRARGSIGEGFNKLLKTSGANIFGPLTAGAQLLGKVLPRLSPITDAFGNAITGVINQLSKFSDSRGFASVVNFIATRGVSAFKQFVGITGNLAGGIGGLIKAFTPLGTTVLSSIERATGAFRRFGEAAGAGQSKGFQNFLDYVRRTGPQVGRTLVDIGGAVGKVVLALAPQGSTVLGVIDILAKRVAQMKPSRIAAIAVAVGALGIATGKFSGLKGLSLLIAGLSYAYNHSNAFRTLADDAGKLAAQLNNLPDVAKLLGGAALVGGALKLRGGAATGGVTGAVAKVVGGGIQKVFVVNMAEGGLGVPGKVGKGAAAAEGAAAAGAGAGILATLRAALSKLAIPLPAAGAAGHDTAPKGQDFGGNKLLSSSQAALGRLGKLSGEPIGNLTEISVAISKVDANFAKLAASNPQKALLAVQAAAASTGVPLKDLQTLLPRTAKSLGDLGKNAKELPGQLSGFGTAANNNRYTLDGLARATSKVGISSGQTAKMLRSLPLVVRTKIETPGALTSRKQIVALAKQFGLTPKQIRTIMTLVGARDATGFTKKINHDLKSLPKVVRAAVQVPGALKSVGDVRRLAAAFHLTPKQVRVLMEILNYKKAKNQIEDVQKGARKLAQTNPKPHVEVQGTPKAQSVSKGVIRTLHAVGSTNPKPHVEVTGTGQAAAAARNVRQALDQIPRNIPVSINIRTYGAARAVGQAQAAANAAALARNRATGGWIHGPGSGTSDSIPVNLSNGEFVVNAAAARQNAALLEAINGRGGTGNRMAAGGTVTGSRAPASFAINYNAPVYAHDPDELARKQAAKDRVAISMASF